VLDLRRDFGAKGDGVADDTAALADDGSGAVVYLPTPRTFTVDFAKLKALVTARWFDPASGAFRDVSGSPFATAGKREFTPPATNSSGESDWVLLLGSHPWHETRNRGFVDTCFGWSGGFAGAGPSSKAKAALTRSQRPGEHDTHDETTTALRCVHRVGRARDGPPGLRWCGHLRDRPVWAKQRHPVRSRPVSLRSA
jgi:hypothetical protein